VSDRDHVPDRAASIFERLRSGDGFDPGADDDQPAVPAPSEAPVDDLPDDSAGTEPGRIEMEIWAQPPASPPPLIEGGNLAWAEGGNLAWPEGSGWGDASPAEPDNEAGVVRSAGASPEAAVDDAHSTMAAPASQAPARPMSDELANGVTPDEPTGGPRRHPGAVRHALPRRLAVANQKGGVGKTTTAVNLGAALAEMDYRVLVIDLDPQGNATTGLGINGRNLDASVYDVILHDVPIEDVIEPTTIRNLFGVPATIDLAGAEIELVPAFSRELRLRRALEPIEADFDFIFIDCPPSLGLITVNGLAAASEVVVPIQCEYYALEGLGQLLRNVGLVQANLNHGLEVSTIILTMYDARTRLAAQVVEEVRQHFGDKVCMNVVPRTVRLSEAPSFGQPITAFDPTSRGAIAYRELAKEVSGGAPQRTR